MKNKIYLFLSICNIITFSYYLFSFKKIDNLTEVNLIDKIIKVRGVVVVDSLGIERAIIGSHLPEPNIANGHRIKVRKKQGSVSGIMLYDSEGQERGGYVTDDNYGNAFLTLDSKTSQQFLLLAEPQGATSLMLYSKNGENKVSLQANDEDASIELKKNNNDIKFYSNEK
ncbi:MAG: hypothetical protein J0L86_05265 [Flavobacteriales bacterium]|nr:hypothetical protein [Flavobacteriales bacterium]